jgi:Na+/alanine symporter
MNALRRSLFALLATVLLVAPAAARAGSPCDPPPSEQPSLGERVDGFFGDWVVGPIASVLFFDLAFWDDTLPLGALPDAAAPDLATPEGRQAVVDAELARRGPEVMGYDADRGYLVRCRTPARLRDAVPVLAEGATSKQGILTLRLAEREGRLFGAWDELPVDPAALGLAPPAASPEAPADAPRIGKVEELPADGERVLQQVEIGAVAPFAVVVDLTRGAILAGEVELPWSTIPVQAGHKVQVGGEVYEVAAASGRRLSLRGLTEHASPDPLPNPANVHVPMVVFWLVVGAVFFTFRFAFVNLRAFGHAIAVVSGRYDHEGDPGEVSHFQALSSALSATVGLGNIAGVAVAVSVGGPGAVVWMVIAAFFGMTSKFTEVTLAQMYRKIGPDGTVSGGPFHYLSTGLAELRLGGLGLLLAGAFSILCVGGSLGGGNMFQGNQSFQAIADVIPALMPRGEGAVVFERLPGADAEITIPARTAIAVPGGPVFIVPEPVVLAAGEPATAAVPIAALRGGATGNVQPGAITEIRGTADDLGRIAATELDDQLRVSNPAATAGGGSWGFAYGLALTVLVGLVIVGGIKRIGATAGYIVPAMGVLYVVAGVWILAYQGITAPDRFIEAIGVLGSSAFSLEAGIGGFIGIIVTGFQRASFSNEAGIGSASIAHSAAATREPVSEGVVALLEPFIDTIVVCLITGLVVVTTGAYTIAGVDGISMTSAAFESGGLPGARYVLAVAVVLFAFSTMISWSYYGEKAATWMFGAWVSTPYKVLFLACAAIGPVITLGKVLDFSDLMILGMAFPNILGMYLLSPKVAAALRDYLGKLRAGTL